MKSFKFAMSVLIASMLVGGVSNVSAGQQGPRSLKGTKCWTLDPVLGKDTFVELTFKRIGNGQSIFSGTAVRTDAQKPDRILQMSGSTSVHSFIGDDETEITRHMLNLTYAFSKTGTNPANAFTETGAALRGHYAIRLDPSSLNGYFEGNDIVMDFPGGLTGPAATFDAQSVNNPYAALGANNYLGGILCDGTVPGFNNCGTIIPVNNAGSLTLVGKNKRQCKNANPFNQ